VCANLRRRKTKTLAATGLSISDAVRVLLARVVAEKQLSFALKVPNIETRVAMAESDAIVRARHACFAIAAELLDEPEKAVASLSRAAPYSRPPSFAQNPQRIAKSS